VSEAVFIAVEVSAEAAADAELAAKLAEVCPVDIFANDNGHLTVVEENLDECVLCELCINAAPPRVVKVLKLYSGESLPP
jgi:NAD-dependent dihydropyrimidine dehydrogenase PreA subunit